MKHIVLTCCSLFGVLTLTACASQPLVIQEPIGPEPSGLSTYLPQGYLVIYTPTDTVDDGEINYYPHTGYDVYTLDGKKIRAVLNHDSVHDEQPQRVALPVGTYKVKADCRVVLTVVIKANKTTVVDLDDSSNIQAAKGTESKVVKTPDGEVVGWKAHS
jgi:hypothetical protein